MDINYERLEWEDFPSTETPINADNLNHLEEGIAGLYAERYEMQSNIAYVEDGETASKDYLPNSYLMRDGLFYKVTKTILYGDSFDSGEDGNIEHVDVSSQFGSGGGGSTGCVELTQAQYDALSDEAKMLDVIYLITDSPDNYLDEVFGDFATVEYTDTASKAYAVGDYLVYDSKFYKVTSAIAQGDTIVPDTNVVKTTVGEEVKALNEKTKTIVLNSTSEMTLQQALEAAWISDIPADSKPHLVYVAANGGALFGTLNRYGSNSTFYGSGLLTRYDGIFYKASLNNNVVSIKSLQEYITPVHTTKSPNNLTIAAHAGASFEVTVTPPAGKRLIAHVAVWGTGGVGVLTNIDGYSTSDTIRPYIVNTNNSSVTLGAAYVVHVLSLYA